MGSSCIAAHAADLAGLCCEPSSLAGLAAKFHHCVSPDWAPAGLYGGSIGPDPVRVGTLEPPTGQASTLKNDKGARVTPARLLCRSASLDNRVRLAGPFRWLQLRFYTAFCQHLSDGIQTVTPRDHSRPK